MSSQGFFLESSVSQSSEARQEGEAQRRRGQGRGRDQKGQVKPAAALGWRARPAKESDSLLTAGPLPDL
jgi:hypothetical protein